MYFKELILSAKNYYGGVILSLNYSDNLIDNINQTLKLLPEDKLEEVKYFVEAIKSNNTDSKTVTNSLQGIITTNSLSDEELFEIKKIYGNNFRYPRFSMVHGCKIK